MSRIVAGLGFLAREDAGEMSPAPPAQFVDLRQLCTFVGEELAAKAAQKEISLKIVAKATAFVSGDPDQLQLLLRNLGDNALKYTAPGGSVTLTLAPAAALGTSASAIITVTDTGIGIADDDLPFVFDRFWRADRARASEGSGLGLAISKRIAEAHGGTLTVESTLGRGTTFTLELPGANSPRRKQTEAQM